jgi:hypothetical protein
MEQKRPDQDCGRHIALACGRGFFDSLERSWTSGWGLGLAYSEGLVWCFYDNFDSWFGRACDFGYSLALGFGCDGLLDRSGRCSWSFSDWDWGSKVEAGLYFLTESKNDEVLPVLQL